MFYKPEKADGTQVQIPWQIKTLYYNMAWPLIDNPTVLIKLLDYFLIAIEGFAYILVDEGEMLFIFQNLNDISLSIQGLVTSVVLSECILRIFNATSKKKSCKHVYKTFFEHIYIDTDENPTIWKDIQKSLVPNTVYTYGYMLALFSLIVTPIIRQQNELPYKMILHYNYENKFVYGFTIAYLSLLGCSVIFFYIGDGYLLAYCILHLNGRYKMLQEEMEQCSSVVLSTETNFQIAEQFHKEILRFFLKICDLNNFSKLLNEIYSFRIFVMFSFSTVLLCVLCFQVVSLGASSENIGYGSWIVAKISELLIFGTLGSILNETTNQLTTMYYMSNWEQIIFHSTNRKENVLLMKDLQIIMSLHQNPMRLSGNGFFYVSLDTVVKVLRVAFSYFTCLYTLK